MVSAIVPAVALVPSTGSVSLQMRDASADRVSKTTDLARRSAARIQCRADLGVREFSQKAKQPPGVLDRDIVLDRTGVLARVTRLEHSVLSSLYEIVALVGVTLAVPFAATK